MNIPHKIRSILDHYSNESPEILANLTKMLMHGNLRGTGKLVILPVDQGFEHGPARSFAINADAYDPQYHYDLAVEAGLSAYAAPLGMLSATKITPNTLPLILKMNSSNSLLPKAGAPDQAITSKVKDALDLGCVAVGVTIYPGSAKFIDMCEEVKEILREAKCHGLPTIIWSYPRGGDLSKEGESAIDVSAYAAHIAALLGAHIIKVKLPTAHVEQIEAKKIYEAQSIDISTIESRVKHIMQCSFNGKRIVIFSGGAAKGVEEILQDIRAINTGGGNGSIIGRNIFQRPREDALKLLDEICNIFGKIQD